jgi:hypothetical protein
MLHRGWPAKAHNATAGAMLAEEEPMVSLLPVVVSGALLFTAPTDPPPSADAPSYAWLSSPARRVRATDPRVKQYLIEGFERSATFARLLTTLNATDVIVYIERVMTLPHETMGRLTMVPMTSGPRYLRIQIRSDLSATEAIALIGHEMQHALEVADAPLVRDSSALIALYQRIGHSSGGEHVYDTDAAQVAGRRVRRELIGA